tara:strand:- start:271 stop:447 length:177 start_codon:yes stop_codon:yes gene_type:complete
MHITPQHKKRIEKLSYRYRKALDLFSGKPLEGEDLKDWKLTEELKTQWANKFGKELQK